MKKRILLLVIGIISSLHAEPAQIIIDAPNVPGLPKHFRATSLLHSNLNDTSVSQEGLSSLSISGSAQFSEAQLADLKTVLPNLKVVVDLRQESHGFLNGDAISWFVPKNWVNLGLSEAQIQKTENTLLQTLSDESSVTIFKLGGQKDKPSYTLWQTLKPKRVEDENAVTQRYGISYYRIYVPDDQSPTPQQIDTFVHIWETRPQGAPVHFHCENGHGRTTTFMVLADILENAAHVSLQDILARQALIGGVDLTKLPSKEDYKYPYEVQRLKVIQSFYDFAKNTTSPRPQYSLWKHSTSKDTK